MLACCAMVVSGLFFAGSSGMISASALTKLTTFSDGTATKSFLFPIGGGSDDSAKVSIPMSTDIMVLDAKIDITNDLPLKQLVIITEHSGVNLIDYPVLLIVDTASLIGAGKMRSDCGDMRFKDTAENDLFYWIESGCNSNSTRVWVQIPSIPTNGQTTIYMHYHRPILSESSFLADPSKVFIYGDNFESYADMADMKTSWTMTTNGRGDVTYHADLSSADFQSPNHSLRLGWRTHGNIGGVDVWTKMEKQFDLGTEPVNLKFKARITASNQDWASWLKVLVDDGDGVEREVWRNNAGVVGTNWDDKDAPLVHPVTGIPYSGLVTIKLLRQHTFAFHTLFYSHWDDLIIRKAASVEPTFSFPGSETAAEGIPIDAKLDVGSNGNMEWQNSFLVTRETVSGWGGELNSLRETCTCAGCSISGGNCVIDLNIIVSSGEGMILDNLQVVYGSITGGLVPCGRMFNDPNTSWNEKDDCTLCHLILMAQLIMDFLFKIAAVVAAFFLAIAGFIYIFAAGQPDKITLAKKIFSKVLIGFMIIFIAWIIVDTILVMFGYIDPLENNEWHIMC